MKIFLPISVVFIVLVWQACKTPSADSAKSADSTTLAHTPERADFGAFVEKFEWALKDSLEVFSGSYFGQPDYPYTGTEIDSLDLRWLPVTSQLYDPFYRCLKIRLDSVHDGLLVRTPSEYESSSIKLFVTNNTGRFVQEQFIELAESFGDAGYSMDKRTWIFNTKSKPQFLIWVHDADDRSVEDENDTTVVTTDYTCLIAWNGHNFDTLGVNKREYLLQFLTLSNKAKSAGQ
ncbi:hypothetical protein [Chryseolinea lacunae]|uniref:Lipoprotein n=1 Tax=Chryseolinea lacunae TaxID=2801331 RepID=A0ABS1KTR0_9BACT|nr:hypothetical protein [Chryseolinea lacunae]MBL0742745.1 hypothetical protein [Chryseolinea lacunae]